MTRTTSAQAPHTSPPWRASPRNRHAARHHHLPAAGGQYTPIHALVFTFSYRHELRDSNQPQFGYSDDIANAGVKFKF